MTSFWLSIWPIGALFFFILLGVNALFFMNYTLWSLLEREDWPAAALFLEKEVIQKGRYSLGKAQLLGNAYLVLADIDGALRLENLISMAKPALLERLGLLFGAARILGRDYSGAARFFQDRIDHAKKPRNETWLRWYMGFALLLDRKREEAADCFLEIAYSGKQGIPTGMASYLLGENLARFLPHREEELLSASEAGKARVLGRFKTKAAWEREAGKLKTEAYAAAALRYIDEAAQWLYSPASNS